MSCGHTLPRLWSEWSGLNCVLDCFLEAPVIDSLGMDDDGLFKWGQSLDLRAGQDDLSP